MDETGEVRKILSGSFLLVALTYLSRAFNLAAQILLARLLLPTDFGYVTRAMYVFAFFAALKEFGLSFALLHHRDRAEEMAPTHLVLNTALAAAGMGLAAATALWLDIPTVTPIILWLAAFNLLKSASLTPEILLRKDFEFTWLAVAHGAATVLSLTAAVLLAWKGYGVWALVVGYTPHSIGYVAIFSVLVWVRKANVVSKGFRLRRDHARRLFGYGRWYWISGMVTYLTLQYDKFIVDRLVGINSLGLYERAYTYAQMPTGAITHVIASVTSSVYARYQKDRESLSRAFTKVFGIIFRVSAPVALILFVEAEALTHLLLGKAWLGLIPVLRWLIVYAFLKPLLDDAHSLLLAIGQPRKITAFTSVQAIVFLVLTPILTHRLGMKGTAVSVDIMTAIGFWLSIRYAVRYVDVPWFRIVGPSTAATLAAALVCAYVPVSDYFASPWAGLGAEIALLLSVYVGALLAIEGRRILGEARQVYRIFADRAALDG